MAGPKRNSAFRLKPENPLVSAIGIWVNSLPEPKHRILLREFQTLDGNVFEGLDINGTNEKEDSNLRRIRDALVRSSPRRWSTYKPMVVLPGGSFDNAVWKHVLHTLAESGDQPNGIIDSLWREILNQIAIREFGHARVEDEAPGGSTGQNTTLTHLAVNEGIPLHQSDTRPQEITEQENESTEIVVQSSDADIARQPQRQSMADPQSEFGNILRSPTGLRMLYGDFGPFHTADLSSPSQDAFSRAFWASTRQNGIMQTWAPRWTMFSRGNVKEKARLLKFPDERMGGSTPISRRKMPQKDNQRLWAVDLYAGIGYFTFSYARLGFKVLCWELNPWSVEGLRRGAIANGWSVRVIHPSQSHGERLLTSELVRKGELSGNEQIIVFMEDNLYAGERIRDLRNACSKRSEPQARNPDQEETENGVAPFIVHINCGLLPKSDLSWRTAWESVGRGLDRVTGGEDSDKERGSGRTELAWLHLHENVAEVDIESRGNEIEALFQAWDSEGQKAIDGRQRRVEVEHVERVKTFAPGVWHCVFDVKIVGES